MPSAFSAGRVTFVFPGCSDENTSRGTQRPRFQNQRNTFVMIPNHPRFIEAINEKKKVRVKFYSIADSGIVDRICAPMDYGPGGTENDGLNRYWLWDYAGNSGAQTLGLLPQAITDLQILGDVFDPAQFDPRPAPWSTPRDWGTQS